MLKPFMLCHPNACNRSPPHASHTPSLRRRLRRRTAFGKTRHVLPPHDPLLTAQQRGGAQKDHNVDSVHAHAQRASACSCAWKSRQRSRRARSRLCDTLHTGRITTSSEQARRDPHRTGASNPNGVLNGGEIARRWHSANFVRDQRVCARACARRSNQRYSSHLLCFDVECQQPRRCASDRGSLVIAHQSFVIRRRL